MSAENNRSGFVTRRAPLEVDVGIQLEAPPVRLEQLAFAVAVAPLCNTFENHLYFSCLAMQRFPTCFSFSSVRICNTSRSTLPKLLNPQVLRSFIWEALQSSMSHHPNAPG